MTNIITIDKPPSAPLWADAPAQYWWINVGAFFDRFGTKALDITSSTDPQVQGAVMLIMPRMYVDLKRPDLSQILDLLVAKGLITAEEKTAIISPPTTDYERYIKGLPQPIEG
jgi:CRP-like cAMP-binding protein